MTSGHPNGFFNLTHSKLSGKIRILIEHEEKYLWFCCLFPVNLTKKPLGYFLSKAKECFGASFLYPDDKILSKKNISSYLFFLICEIFFEKNTFQYLDKMNLNTVFSSNFDVKNIAGSLKNVIKKGTLKWQFWVFIFCFRFFILATSHQKS